MSLIVSAQQPGHDHHRPQRSNDAVKPEKAPNYCTYFYLSYCDGLWTSTRCEGTGHWAGQEKSDSVVSVRPTAYQW